MGAANRPNRSPLPKPSFVGGSRGRRRIAAAAAPLADNAAPKVAFQPAAGQGLSGGLGKIARLASATLGPPGHLVAVGGNRGDPPEVLDDAGVIVRRILELVDPTEDPGAMMARHTMWQQREQVGDGAAVTAVLLEEIYRSGMRYVRAGGDPATLRIAVERGGAAAAEAITTMARPIDDKSQLSDVLTAGLGDAELASAMAGVFDVMGPLGLLEIRKGRTSSVEVDFIDGPYWRSRILFGGPPRAEASKRLDLVSPLVLVSDLDVVSPSSMTALTRMAAQQARPVLAVVSSVSPALLAPLGRMASRESLPLVIVQAPSQPADLEDLAVLSSAQPIVGAAGSSLEGARASHLGHVRKAWVTPEFFGIVGPGADPRLIKQRIAALIARSGADLATTEVAVLRERAGRLLGAGAVVRVGSASPLDVERRVDRATRAAALARAAIEGGVVPGGGACYLMAASSLDGLAAGSTEASAVARRILLRSLEEPARTIARNHGFDPGVVAQRVAAARPGYGFDATCGRVVDMAAAGILDVASVAASAVKRASSVAALLLTTEAVVTPRRRSKSLKP